MIFNDKQSEVQFYLDRSKEAFITILRSIVENPRLSPEESFRYLKEIHEQHSLIASFVQQKVIDGQSKGYEMLGVASK